MAPRTARRLATGAAAVCLAAGLLGGCADDAGPPGPVTTPEAAIGGSGVAGGTTEVDGQGALPAGGTGAPGGAAPADSAVPAGVGAEGEAPPGSDAPRLLADPPDVPGAGLYAPFGVRTDGVPIAPADAPPDVRCAIIKGARCGDDDLAGLESMCLRVPDFCASYEAEGSPDEQ